MMGTGPFLKAGLQIGPWRITRKVLIMVACFCVIILCFGVSVLETHAFEPWDTDDDDTSGEEDDGYQFGNGASDGDYVMMFFMVCAGIVGIAAVVACFFAQSNVPRHLESERSSRNNSIYTIEADKHNNIQRTASVPGSHTQNWNPQHPVYHHTLEQTQSTPTPQTQFAHHQAVYPQPPQIIHQSQYLQQSEYPAPPPPYNASAPPQQLSTIHERPPPYAPNSEKV